MMCVVDTEGDSVRCFRREQIAKSFPTESGTSVSVLVPVRYRRNNVNLMYLFSRNVLMDPLFLVCRAVLQQGLPGLV